MATDGAEDLDYESDPEEVKRSLTMRRREASDDEDESGEKPRGVNRRAPIHSDESDGQGGAGEYDEEVDEEELGLEEEEEEEIDEELQEAYEESNRQRVAVRVEGSEAAEPKAIAGDEVAEEQADGSQVDGEEAEKKENEPFAVPTAGAFYMHDDRFRDSSGGRHSRRTPGGRKLWESRDDRKWGHDKYEEIAHHDRGYQEGRSSRGNMRGRGRNRGGDRGGYGGRSGKPRAYNNDPDQNQGPKNVRGKGTRKYEPAAKNKTQQPIMQNKQAGRSNEKPLNSNSARTYAAANHAEFEPASARKNVFASSLNSASPPFYPSASSNSNFTQKRDGQGGNNNRNFRQSAGDNSSARGKNVADSVNLDKLKIDDSLAGKSSSDMGNSVNTSQTRVHGRANIPAQMTYQPVNHNQAMRGSLSAVPHGAHRGPIHGRGQKFSGSQSSSPPKTSLSITTYEPGEADSVSESNKSKTTIVAKGKGAAQGSGRGSVMYNGPQVVGSAAMGDQNFPGAPTFLPVMQFGGQHHPGGMGVPAVGMAFPGYVGQPQGLGIGNTEMTWLPVLAGAAGAYCPPYIVDGNYHARPSAQSTSGSAPSKENNTTTKPNSEWKSSQRLEIVSDEFGQRQNKPRRYSEMNFGQ